MSPAGLSTTSRCSSSYAMRSSIGSGASGAGAAGASNSTSSPAASRWLFGRGEPSTSTAPASTSRAAAAREPTSGSPARKRSSRSPSAWLGMRRRVAHPPGPARVAVGHEERDQEDDDAEDDEAVREVERGPEAEIEEVRDMSEPDAVDEVGDAPADQQAEGDRQHGMPCA